jgi:3'(2'), 5'-bisphosphate nucleotidase
MPAMGADLALARRLHTIAVTAGAAILAVYDQADCRVEHKADRSPLTEADLRSHECIVAGLMREFPGVPIISEECEESRAGHHHTSFFLVDPLDGTREFIKRNGEFCVCIALLEQGEVVASAVHGPHLARSVPSPANYSAYAAQGQGAFNAAGAQLQNPAMPVARRFLGSRSHMDPRTAGFLARAGISDVTPLGSALKFLAIAAGAAELYVRFGPTSHWDTAAAELIAREAGASVADLNGAPLGYRYRADRGYLNPDFAVLARGLPVAEWLALAS